MSRFGDFLKLSLGCLLLASCGGGGGDSTTGGGGPTVYSGPTISPAGRAVVGTLGTPELRNSTGAETFGSPGFVGSNVAAGTKFGLLQSSMQVQPNTLTTFIGPNSAPINVDADGATLELVSAPYSPGPGGEGDSLFLLSVPDLNINNVQVVVNNSGGVPLNPVSGGSPQRILTVGVDNLNYMLAGAWVVTLQTNNALQNFGLFVTGYQTPVGSLPIGSATFTGDTSAIYITGANAADQYVIGGIEGNVSFDVNFASGVISGAMTNMMIEGATGSAVPWNNISFAANVTGGSADFTGTTNTTSAPGGSMSLPLGSTGYVAGSFFGPNAEEAGAVWSVYNDNKTVVGAFSSSR